MSTTDAAAGHGHSNVKLYWIFCFVLCAITGLEWAIFKYKTELSISDGFMIPALLGMSLVKFIMVVGWYMHLRYDHNWIKYIFIFSFLMAMMVLYIFMASL